MLYQESILKLLHAFRGFEKNATAPPCFPLLDRAKTRCINFTRSSSVCLANEFGRIKKREQVNELTAFVDGSQVYGSDDGLAKILRSSNGKYFSNAYFMKR